MRNFLKKIDLSAFFALAMLFSGASLLVAVYLNFSLALALGLLGIAALSCMGLVWVNISELRRKLLKRQLIVGLIAGIAATLAYDIARLLLVYFGQMHINPFETFNVFGKLIVGSDMPRNITLPVGTIYHFLNGICFAIAYTIMLGARNWKFGIVWAFVLESFMLTLYPGWLNLDAVIKEFVAVSLVGHVVYGSVLGIISQRFLQKPIDSATKTT